MQPLRATQEQQLKAYEATGNAGRAIHQSLNEVQRHLDAGVYYSTPGLPLALKALELGQYGVLRWAGWDVDKLARTQQVMKLGDALLTDRVNLGRGITNEEGRRYENAAGNLQHPQSQETMNLAIESMRRTADQGIKNSNTALEHFNKTRQLLPFPDEGTGGTDRPRTLGTVDGKEVTTTAPAPRGQGTRPQSQAPSGYSKPDQPSPTPPPSTPTAPAPTAPTTQQAPAQQAPGGSIRVTAQQFQQKLNQLRAAGEPRLTPQELKQRIEASARKNGQSVQWEGVP